MKKITILKILHLLFDFDYKTKYKCCLCPPGIYFIYAIARVDTQLRKTLRYLTLEIDRSGYLAYLVFREAMRQWGNSRFLWEQGVWELRGLLG